MCSVKIKSFIPFQISMSKIVRSEENRSEITPRLENEKELTSMIMDMETKHGKISS